MTAVRREHIRPAVLIGEREIRRDRTGRQQDAQQHRGHASENQNDGGYFQSRAITAVAGTGFSMA